MQKTSRNNALEFYRFVFSIAIFFLHFRRFGSFPDANGAFNAGYLAVEFFFIVSGVFLMHQIDKKNQDSFSFLLGRYRKLYPQYLLSLIILIIYYLATHFEADLGTKILKSIPDFLITQIFWRPGTLNGHLWFVSGLIWGSLLLYVLLRRFKSLPALLPFLVLGYIGWASMTFGHIDIIASSDVPLFSAFFRSIADMAAGCLVAKAYDAIKKRNIVINTFLMTVIEVLLFGISIYVMYETRHTYLDFVMVPVLSLLVLTALMKQGMWSRLLDNQVSGFLGGLSLSIYMNQQLFQLLARFYARQYSYWIVAIAAFIALCIYAFLITKIIDFCRTRINKRYRHNG